MIRYDIAVIGAGAVGCAIARTLALRYPSKRIAVFERLPDAGQETSLRNSGILHSGMHERPGSWKADFSREGSHLAVDYHRSLGLPIRQCGMLVAVSSDAMRRGLYKEWRSLWSLIQRGRAQDISFTFLTRWGVQKLEPEVQVLGGIYIPNVWVIDPTVFVRSLRKDAENAGAEFFFESPVTALTVSGGVWHIETSWRRFASRVLVNAAGLYADDIAALAGCPYYKIYPWRGEYYEIVNPRYTSSVRHLVNPVMPHTQGKGILLGPRLDGRLYIGPNNRLVPRKDYYMEDRTPPDVFVQAARRFLPDITAKDLSWAYEGMRPKLSDTAQESDFIIQVDRAYPPLVNLVGIDSPGLSAAMAIARYVASMPAIVG